MVDAVATASLSGGQALQGRQAARGLQLWAETDGVDLDVADDESSASTARDRYRRFLDAGADLVLGPYGSGLVRSVAPLVRGRDVVLWNHGGASDDLAAPLVVSVPAPSSTYFRGIVELAADMGLRKAQLAAGPGRFAAAVVSGARQHADGLGLEVEEADLRTWSPQRDLADTAVMIVGTFADDIACVERILSRFQPGLLGCVAAGLREFGRRLGEKAEGVVGPVQWVPRAAEPKVGIDPVDFAARYERAFGEPPGYLAAQAAAAGYLAAEAHRRGYDPDRIRAWETSTLLGAFSLDEAWRQVGHAAVTIRWRNGRRVPVS